MKFKPFLGPVITTVLVNIYYIGFVFLCVKVPAIPTFIKIVLGALPLVLSFFASSHFAKKAEDLKKQNQSQRIRKYGKK